MRKDNILQHFTCFTNGKKRQVEGLFPGEEKNSIDTQVKPGNTSSSFDHPSRLFSKLLTCLFIDIPVTDTLYRFPFMLINAVQSRFGICIPF